MPTSQTCRPTHLRRCLLDATHWRRLFIVRSFVLAFHELLPVAALHFRESSRRVEPLVWVREIHLLHTLFLFLSLNSQR